MSQDALNPTQRAEDLSFMQDNLLDVLVVGAGATGAGTALDAASRGLVVGLVDKGDIASGTSSRSSSLVHGGLRYLQQGNVALVREALRERELLLTRLAPHLVEPLKFLFPLRHRAWQRAFVGTGLEAYDLLGGAKSVPRHRHLSKKQLMSEFPDLDADKFVGGLSYYDARMDDARLAVALARTAKGAGAHLATYVKLEAASKNPDSTWTVLLKDADGAEYTVRTRTVALCVGVWAGQLGELFQSGPAANLVVQSKGVHLRLPVEAIRGSSAVIAPTEKSVLFILPHRTHWLVGTTDTAYKQDMDDVGVTGQDVEYLLEHLNEVLGKTVEADQVTYAFAGLRPLALDSKVGGNTAKASREHRISRLDQSVLSIVGGKWTTYRVMAEDLVDTLLKEPTLAEVKAGPSRTEQLVLAGAEGDCSQLAWAGRYGSRWTEVAKLAQEDPDKALELAGAPEFIKAQVSQAVRFEGARFLADVLDRRLRLGRELDTVSESCAAEVAELMSAELGWNEEEQNRQLRCWLDQQQSWAR